MEKIVYIENNSTDPAYNLALEEYVFDCLPGDRNYFWLWQNDRTVVVGKHQNTVEEINQDYVKKNDIHVVRRLSGGGAVYHDLGNVNFTFIADAGNVEQLNLSAFCEPVVKTLKKMGVAAEVSGRNDITIDGKKFSGNSQYIKQGRIMHHGTLMFDSDLSVVSRALQVSKDKYTSKGFRSVASRVTNIRPYVDPAMNMEQFRSLLKSHILENMEVEVYSLTRTDRKEILERKHSRYDTWEWNYGVSLDYEVTRSRRVEGCGQITLKLRVEKGILLDAVCFGDFFGEGMTESLRKRLVGLPLREDVLERALADVPLERHFANLDPADFIGILVGVS